VPLDMSKQRITNKIKNKFKIAAEAQKENKMNALLQTQERGCIVLEDGEQYPTQKFIRKNVACSVKEKAFSLDLEEDCWKSSYSLDGRHIILHSRSVVAAFDCKTLNVFFERTLRNIETSIFLHNEQYCAIASDTLFIYNKNGLEVHHLSHERNVRQMVYLPHHFLLVTLSDQPFIRYLDTSMGKEVAKLYIKEPSCGALSRRDDGIVLVGGTRGVVRFFSPNAKEPLCSLLVNSSKISSIAVKKNNFVCSSLQGTNFYDFRNLNEPVYRLPKSENVSLSHVLAMSYKNRITTFLNGTEYVKETYQSINSIEFAPYEDILAVGTKNGLSHMIVPGAGDPNIDFYEDSPFLTKKQRREREIKKLMEKIPSSFIGSKFIVEEVVEEENEEKKDEPRKRTALSRFY
ncbi:WD40-repeat-containing subunit of the 18S rRNA processing complex, partial [Trachipleistophora hominis]